MQSWEPHPSSRAPVPDRLSWRLVLLVPGAFPGAMLHHAALWAAASGARDLSRRLFAAAARRYREELSIEPLVRLRIHEAMYAATDPADSGADPSLEIERWLLALDRIESPRSPFSMVDARTLVTTWPTLLARQASAPAADGRSPHPLRAV